MTDPTDQIPQSRVTVNGNRVSDLIEALRKLDPDTKVAETQVYTFISGGYRHLSFRYNPA